MDVTAELKQIGRMMEQAAFMDAIRREVRAVMRSGVVVTDGAHHPQQGYSIIVRAGTDLSTVSRRIRANMPDVDVDELADGVLGIRTARRGSNNGK